MHCDVDVLCYRFTAEGPHLTKLPDFLLQTIAKQLSHFSDVYVQTQDPQALQYGQQLVQSLIVICRSVWKRLQKQLLIFCGFKLFEFVRQKFVRQGYTCSIKMVPHLEHYVFKWFSIQYIMYSNGSLSSTLCIQMVPHPVHCVSKWLPI